MDQHTATEQLVVSPLSIGRLDKAREPVERDSNLAAVSDFHVKPASLDLDADRANATWFGSANSVCARH